MTATKSSRREAWSELLWVGRWVNLLLLGCLAAVGLVTMMAV